MPEPRDVEQCEFMHVHEDIVAQVEKNMPDEEVLYDLAELFKIFGDSTRIKILYVLNESEMCVCDIARLLGMTQSAISHQLRSLKQSKLVKARREGRRCSTPWPTIMSTPSSARAWSMWLNCCPSMCCNR